MSRKTDKVECTSLPLHVYNRAVSGESLFRDVWDYRYWLELVATHLPAKQVVLLAYSLMPNHFHFSVEQRKSYAISKLMHAICTTYVRRFNRRWHRHGHLFEGDFEAKLVPDEYALLRLSHYIHSNPVKAGLVIDPQSWKYSSYTEYVSDVPQGLIHVERILRLVDGRENYRRFMLEYNPADALSIFQFCKSP